jgi:hypothetical protein
MKPDKSSGTQRAGTAEEHKIKTITERKQPNFFMWHTPFFT